MDDFQKNLIEMRKQVPDCTTSRQRLRSVMSDFFPGEKRRINAVLNAYDEDIESRLNNSTDKTLTSLQLVKVLKNDYGLTDDNAVEAIAAWCIMMGLDDIADALGNISPATGTNTNPSTPSGGSIPLVANKQISMTTGIYMAGLDFPAGDVKIAVESIDKGQKTVYYAILKKGSNSNSIIANGFVKSQVILTIKDGQRLQIMHGEVLLTSITNVN